MYPPEITQPMSAELTAIGFEELRTPEEVESAFSSQEGVAILVINSVCGCAAASARPAVKLALQHEKKPTRLLTVFAGVDNEATAKAREYMLPFPPSSPCIAIFRDGKVAHVLERRHIEGRSAEMIAENIKGAFDDLC